MIERSLQTGFPEGNLEQYFNILTAQVPRIANLLFKTIDPLICGCLIDLLGNSTQFRKKSGTITSRQNTNSQNFEICLKYLVPDFIGYSGNKEPIIQDQKYILQKLQQIPGIQWLDTSVKIIPSDGSVTVLFTIPVTGAY